MMHSDEIFCSSACPSKSQGYINFTLSVCITPIKTKRAVKVLAWFEIN